MHMHCDSLHVAAFWPTKARQQDGLVCDLPPTFRRHSAQNGEQLALIEKTKDGHEGRRGANWESSMFSQ